MDETIVPNEEIISGGLPHDPGDEHTGEKKPVSLFLELIYGILFTPSATFHKIHRNPPYVQTIFIFTLVNIFTYAMNSLVASRLMHLYASDHMALVIKVIFPSIGILGLFFQYVKWFFYSAFLHLIAELLSGKGKATGVWIVAGLACLPSILLIPINLLLLISGLQGITVSLISTLSSLVFMIWGAVLLMLGIRQEHHLPTGRALTVVVFVPVATFLVSILILLIAFLLFANSFWPLLPKLNY
jgi:hypothetical protein